MVLFLRAVQCCNFVTGLVQVGFPQAVVAAGEPEQVAESLISTKSVDLKSVCDSPESWLKGTYPPLRISFGSVFFSATYRATSR